MVSKVAVMALVAVIAVPILLGYALNLNETTETVYTAQGEQVNVSQLLQNGEEYTYTMASTYELNSKFAYIQNQIRYDPEYTFTSAATSMPMGVTNETGSWVPTGRLDFSDYTYFSYIADYDYTVGSLKITLYYDNNGTLGITGVSNVHSVWYDYATNTVRGTYYDTIGGVTDIYGFVDYPGDSIEFTTVNAYDAETSFYYLDSSVTNSYVDISSGYYLNTHTPNISLSDDTYIKLPNNTRSALMTFDLNTITSSSNTFKVIVANTASELSFVKTTVGTTEKWDVYDYGVLVFENIIYDQTRSSNTYQLFANGSEYELRYVGDWPQLIGAANYYYTYKGQFQGSSLPGFNTIRISGVAPLFRMDSAEYRSFTYSVINNQTYNPGIFKQNPSTSVKDVKLFGDSITFAGVTYAVDSKGNIMLGTHKTSVNGMVFDSVPVYGGYNNRINGNVINTTANPGEITFTGKWSASVSTVAQAATTVTKTDWNAGSFAWDGIDQNFLIVGLITCLGAFVALGIYARKSRSGGIIPLMIVTGCAAMVFFIMI